MQSAMDFKKIVNIASGYSITLFVTKDVLDCPHLPVFSFNLTSYVKHFILVVHLLGFSNCTSITLCTFYPHLFEGCFNQNVVKMSSF